MTARELALAALLVAAACSVDARSDDYRCEQPTDCDGDRTCVGGWCVATATGDDGGGGGLDAQPDALECPAVCDTCQDGTCIIDCSQAGACQGGITCPAGIGCQVVCSSTGACDGAIDCSMATDCEVACTGTGTCTGTITCGPGACNITCSAAGSCSGDLDCAASCACQTDCASNACSGNTSCPDALPGVCSGNDECTTGPGQCDRCNQ